MNEPLPYLTEEEIDQEEDRPLHDGSPKHEAERKAAIIKTRILEIAYQEKKGELLPREKVDKVLNGFGLEIRNSIQGVTNRVIDKILASNSRLEAKRLLDDEIHETLNILADITSRQI